MTRNPDDMENPINFIRKCPHCQKFFIFVEGQKIKFKCGETDIAFD